MARLTKRSPLRADVTVSASFHAVLHLLADYEDTDRTPKQINEMKISIEQLRDENARLRCMAWTPETDALLHRIAAGLEAERKAREDDLK